MLPLAAVAPDGSWWTVGARASGGWTVDVSSDGGRAWSAAAGQGLSDRVDTLQPISAHTAWATVRDGDSSTVLATADGGATWTALTPST